MPKASLLFLALALTGCASGSDHGCPQTSGTACLWAGTGEPGFNHDGVALLESRLYWPIDLEFTKAGVGYVLDWNNHRVRRVTDDGKFETVVGDFIGDGSPAADESRDPGAPGTEINLNHPTDLQISHDGRVYIAAWHNHKIRRFDPKTNDVVIVAGSRPGFSGDGGDAKAALLNQPKAIVFDAKDNMYVLDQRNQRVRRIGSDGMISSVVGDGMSGYSGDGGAPIAAELSFATGPSPEPSGALAVDTNGALYVADGLNHCIRRVDFETGKIETIVGHGLAVTSANMIDVAIGDVRDMEFGPDGRLYVADTDNHVIRALDLRKHKAQMVAGTGEPGRDADASLDGQTALHTALNRPMGISFDPDGNLYIADTYHNRILKVWQ